MTSRLPLTIVIALACTHAAWADDECHRPVAQWQPREAVAAHVAAQGITIDRLHIDDGCYELRGRDTDGNRLHLTLDPVTLEILSMRVRFDNARVEAGQEGHANRIGPLLRFGQPASGPQTVPFPERFLTGQMPVCHGQRHGVDIRQ